MTTSDQVSFATRRKLQNAGIPFDQCWDKQGLYIGHWLEHRLAGKKTSVNAACKASGWTPDALRQRRRHNATFRAAEKWARKGIPYVDPDPADEPDPETALDVVVPEITITNTELYRHPAMTAAPRATLRGGVPVWASLRDPFGEEF